MSITHNENLNPLLNLLTNCISARASPQILSIKNECTYLLLNSRIIEFCNSFVNFLLDITLFLTFPPNFSIKKIVDY